MMKLRYFPVNVAWGFTFGKNKKTMQLIAMCKNKQRLFEHRETAVYEAERCGLKVSKRGTVSVIRTDTAKKPLTPSEAARAMRTDGNLNGGRRS